MKAKLLVISLSLIIITACNKDKFSTTPTLTFEGINGTTFGESQNIQIKLRMTDKDGDFLNIDSTGFTKPYLFYQRFSYKCQVDEDTLSSNYYEIPTFPTNKFLDVDLDVQFTYGTGEGPFPTISGCTDGSQKDDSTYFRFWMKDEAGHVSDTVTTPTFKLLSIN